MVIETYYIFLTLTVLVSLIIMGVLMDQAIANVQAALVALNAKIDAIQPSSITAADVQGVADSITAATEKLVAKFPSA